jgi:hypothetical protein
MEAKNFYMVEEELITKKVFFFKKNESLIFVLEEDAPPAKDYEKVGEVVYTLFRPSWRLKNVLRSMASSANIMGVSAVDPYILNNLIVKYILRDWSLDRKFKIIKESGFEVIENVEELIGSKIEPAVFDAVIHLYNRFFS